MLTQLGELLRGIRKENDEQLLEMANKLEVAFPYISALEHGENVLTYELFVKINNSYNLTEEIRQKLSDCINIDFNTKLENIEELRQEIKLLQYQGILLMQKQLESIQKQLGSAQGQLESLREKLIQELRNEFSDEDIKQTLKNKFSDEDIKQILEGWSSL